MCRVSDTYSLICEAIDRANADDPHLIEYEGVPEPLARLHGTLAARFVLDLDPHADEGVLVAARGHHLRRWQLPRSDYPDGRAGYLRWRRDQKVRHAHDIAALLSGLGWQQEAIADVQALVRRDGLGTDPRAQLVEDAACLVFLVTQLDDLLQRVAAERMDEVIRRTAAKMSASARAAIGGLALSDVGRAALARALP